MNSTTNGVDARGYLIGWLHGLTSMYMADIKAIPEDKLTVSPGGVARTVQDVTGDTLGLLHWVTEALKGNIIADFSEAAQKAQTDTLTSHAAIEAAMQDATNKMAEAIGQASDETLNATIMAPWQMETPMFMMAMIAVNHIWYHDGQLNYFQALNGDGEIHWMMN